MESAQAESSSEPGPDFVSLGMVVLDELQFPNRSWLTNVPGGSGLYATFGSRLCRTDTGRPIATGFILLAGDGFPQAICDTIHSWGVELLVRVVEGSPSTRGRLVYEDDAFGRKSFEYVTPPLRPSPADLEGTSLLKSKCFHILALPEEVIRQVTLISRLRAREGLRERPLIVWEPAPSGCDVGNLGAHMKACKVVDVFSPNHLELRKLVEGDHKAAKGLSRAAVEIQAKKFLDGGVGRTGEGLVVVRAGEHGSLTLSEAGPQWLPPFFQGESAPSTIVDPTGAGNTFLGAFAATYQATGSSKHASINGAVAASYALQQFGVPSLSGALASSTDAPMSAGMAARTEAYKRRHNL